LFLDMECDDVASLSFVFRFEKPVLRKRHKTWGKTEKQKSQSGATSPRSALKN